jgi:hypothetical protein
LHERKLSERCKDNVLKNPNIPPVIGELIRSKFSHVHIWDENLEEEIDEVGAGHFMIVLAIGHPHRPKRLNPNLYRKVLTANKKIGWVHLDNCESMARYI